MSEWLQISPRNQTIAAWVSQASIFWGLWLVWDGSASGWGWVLSLTVYRAMQLSITVGCHRLFTHRTFDCHRTWHWVFAYFATLTWQASTVSWVHVHYTHHAFSDTDQDPHISDWSFFLWKRYRTLKGRYARIVADMVKDPLHSVLHRYAILVILLTGVALWLVDPMLPLFGLAIPMGYYFITSGMHQIFSHYQRIPRNLPWVELILPMGEWNHANHHLNPSEWDFGKYDLGSHLIRWIKR